MKSTRKVHLWIGLICSIFIFLESLTGLIMNEPWLIGQQTQTFERGNFQPGQFQGRQGITNDSAQNSGQTEGQANGSTDGQTNGQMNGQTRGQFGMNGQFPAGGERGAGFTGEEGSSQSLMGIIRELHEGRIGTTNIKWLIDLVAVAMMILTGTGIYLSIKILGAERKRKKAGLERETA
ncbi:PepSY-associated TM helix domain-containing protein [Neobacillus muris]|uniref:PepSY-associated TM helix domain-containing protein n=1 Tax=Neobacillus muris TaxID=2941334 RepID=UPI002040F6CE|nr:PepSY-associated TM helix domain-containing protein [Neobacillus muris]